MSTGESNDPRIIFDGKSFQIAWWDMRSTEPEIFLQGLDKEGFETKPARKLPSSGWAKHPTLSFDGKETHLVWWEEPKVLSARLGDGDPTIKTITDDGTFPSAGAWGGSIFVKTGFLYFHSDGMINLKTGAPLPPKIIAAGGIESPKMVYTGVYYAVVWSESVEGGRRIVLQRVSAQGEKLGKLVILSSEKGSPRNPSVTWNGRRLAAAWTERHDSNENNKNLYQIYFALIPEVGDAPLLSKPVNVFAASGEVDIQTSGDEFALAWSARKTDGGCTIFMRRLDEDGASIGAIVEVSDGGAQICSRPSLAWDGTGYGMVWDDDRGLGETEIYFSYISCGDKEIEMPEQPVVQEENPPEQPSTLPTLKDAF